MKQEDWNEILWKSTPAWRKEQLAQTSDAAALKYIEELQARIKELEQRLEERNKRIVERSNNV